MFKIKNRQMFEQMEAQITPEDQETAWKETENFSNPIARYNAYLNSVCLKTFVAWLQDWLREEKTAIKPLVLPSLKSLITLWEVLNGTAINVGEMRLILIPSDDLDIFELRVPQEWVDNPNWVGDYYLAVGVNLDSDEQDCWLKIAGFATHRKLKNDGVYNPLDRSYSLPVAALNQSLMVMELLTGLDVREELEELEIVSENEAEFLLKKLGNNAIYSPRLVPEVAVEKWVALISNEAWREKLYQKRMGMENVIKPVVNLGRWLEGVLEAGWQSLEETYWAAKESITAQKVYATDWRNEVLPTVRLVMTVTPKEEGKTDICLQLQPAPGELCLQPNVKLIVQNEQQETMQEEEAGRETLFIEINLTTDQPGDQFCVIITAGDQSITETFEV
ncbi:DUF1822 family protein [Ancylothrix sp. C2]|uniref:DUF1822 family protein n=1 Tax=Ancylothrix sp. D3o TaxID=2953691 RepID=UPI0021BB765D|nr:DUF1822 family protein [Ancylothrix sp. D3o]MCT7952009.1 DUF1822 family protein [Ancylothrix sp. D3o]